MRLVCLRKSRLVECLPRQVGLTMALLQLSSQITNNVRSKDKKLHLISISPLNTLSCSVTNLFVCLFFAAPHIYENISNIYC
jgi:hypothetical protein